MRDRERVSADAYLIRYPRVSAREIWVKHAVEIGAIYISSTPPSIVRFIDRLTEKFYFSSRRSPRSHVFLLYRIFLRTTLEMDSPSSLQNNAGNSPVAQQTLATQATNDGATIIAADNAALIIASASSVEGNDVSTPLSSGRPSGLDATKGGDGSKFDELIDQYKRNSALLARLGVTPGVGGAAGGATSSSVPPAFSSPGSGTGCSYEGGTGFSPEPATAASDPRATRSFDPRAEHVAALRRGESETSVDAIHGQVNKTQQAVVAKGPSLNQLVDPAAGERASRPTLLDRMSTMGTTAGGDMNTDLQKGFSVVPEPGEKGGSIADELRRC